VILPDDLALVERFARPGRPLAGGGEAHLDWVAEFFDLPEPDWDEDLRFDEDGDSLDDELFDELLTFARETGVPYELSDATAVDVLLEATRYQQLLHGPRGWFPTLAPNSLLGLRIRNGTIEVQPVHRREIQGPHVGVVAAGVARLARLVIGPDPSWFGPPAIAIEDLLQLVATEAPELLRRPVPPFSELVQRGGLDVHAGLVGHRGTDWDAVDPIPDLHPQDAWGFRPARTIQ
jgi:hypothetical protein